MRIAFLTFAVFSSLAVSSALAQESKESNSLPGLPRPIQSQAPVVVAEKVHSEVILYFKSGDKTKGVIKNNRFTEKAKGKDFITCKPTDEGSGLRLWFVGDTKSYVFYPQHMIQRYQVIRGLSDVEFREIATRVENLAQLAASAKREAEEKAAEAAKEADGKNKAIDPNKKPEAAKAVLPTLTPEQLEELKKQEAELAEAKAVYEKFSPEAGWGQGKLEQIRQRRINGLYPNKEEIEFEKGFEKWKKGFEMALEEQRIRELEAQQKAKEEAANSAEKKKP